MRLVLTIRGVNVVDLELVWPSKPNDAPDAPALEASGAGSFERAEQYGDPATLSGFGFVHPQRGNGDEDARAS